MSLLLALQVSNYQPILKWRPKNLITKSLQRRKLWNQTPNATQWHQCFLEAPYQIKHPLYLVPWIDAVSSCTSPDCSEPGQPVQVSAPKTNKPSFPYFLSLKPLKKKWQTDEWSATLGSTSAPALIRYFTVSRWLFSAASISGVRWSSEQLSIFAPACWGGQGKHKDNCNPYWLAKEGCGSGDLVASLAARLSWNSATLRKKTKPPEAGDKLHLFWKAVHTACVL